MRILHRLIGAIVGTAGVFAAQVPHANATVGSFSSSPAITATSISANGVVFGRQGTEMFFVNLQSPVQAIHADLFTAVVPNGDHIDGDPATTYIEINNTLMLCSRCAPSGRVLCATDATHTEDMYLRNLWTQDSAQMVGAPGQAFPSNSDPALANVGSYVYLFGRGYDNQMYVATYNRATLTWTPFYLVPGSPNDLILSAAASRFKVDGRNDAVVVCGKRLSDLAYWCVTYSPGWGWGSWVRQPFSDLFPAEGSPAIAANGAYEFLMGVYVQFYPPPALNDWGAEVWNGSGWSAYIVGTWYSGKPAVYSDGGNAIAIGRSGRDGTFYKSTFSGSWSAPVQL